MESQQPIVCSHFLRGACRFGDRCRNVHPTDGVPKESRPPILGAPRREQVVKPKEEQRKKGKHQGRPRDKSKYLPKNAAQTVSSSSDYDSTKTAGPSRIRGGVRVGRNTESFQPDHRPADMRIQVEWARADNHTALRFQSRDVVVVQGLFGPEEDRTIYNRLMEETRACGIDPERLFKLWHGDTHMIADDRARGEEDGQRFDFKSRCPTFGMVIDRIREYFGMRIEATRLNWYRDETDWKPFHFDAAAVDEAKSRIQNFTVAVSFGGTREAAFEDADNAPHNRRVISMPQPNGTVYCFSKDINIHWRHGILQKPEMERGTEGRFSIIAWGSVDQRSV